MDKANPRCLLQDKTKARAAAAFIAVISDVSNNANDSMSAFIDSCWKKERAEGIFIVRPVAKAGTQADISISVDAMK